jgi:DNA adenine methylase
MRIPDEFYEILSEAKSQDKNLFYQCQDNLNVIAKGNCSFELGDCDIASQYAYVATQVFSGSKILESKFIDLKGKYASKYDALRRRLQKSDIIDKLNKITHCENLDYTDLISMYDSPKTFFYIDPPYWKTENYYSNHDFDATDHEMLSVLLNEIKGRFILSYYDFDSLSMMYPKDEYRWESREFAKAAGAQKGKKQNKGTELLIMNY